MKKENSTKEQSDKEKAEKEKALKEEAKKTTQGILIWILIIILAYVFWPRSKYIGRFKIGNKIERTYYGYLYQGYDPEAKKDVLIKMYYKPYLEKNQKLYDDIKQLAGTSNVNSLYTVDSEQTKKYFYIITENSEFGNLYDSLIKEHKKYSEDETRSIIKQILNALVYYHNILNITHKEISPKNVYAINKKLVKVNPFTEAGFGHVNKIYNPPESTPPDIYNKKSDMWSVGILAFHLLNGDISKEDEQNLKNGNVYLNRWFISNDCKLFIKKCIEKDYNLRLSSQEAINDKWLKDTLLVKEDYTYMQRLEQHGKDEEEETGIFGLIYYYTIGWIFDLIYGIFYFGFILFIIIILIIIMIIFSDVPAIAAIRESLKKILSIGLLFLGLANMRPNSR